MRRAALLLLLWAGAAQAQSWDFEARIDGKPIGRHRFTVAGPPEAREVLSSAAFDYKLLGLTLYRYRHEAREHWDGDCLRELRSDTDDDGKPLRVRQLLPAEPCLMGFAYWHPRLPEQTQLVDPQTGKLEPARFERLPDAELEVHGKPVPARRWLLHARNQAITVWTARADGAWIGLDARVSGGRTLTYRMN